MKYYKLRNGSMSFEYDMVDNLEQIKVLLAEKNDNLLCGVFSGIISNFIVSGIDILSETKKNIFFIVLMIVIYIIFEMLLKYFRKVKIWVIKYLNSREISDKIEMEERDIFFCKIVEEAILGISLVNRVEGLKRTDEKNELQYIYAQQAKYTFEKIALILENSILEKTKKQMELCVETIGKDVLSWLINTIILYLEKLHSLYEDIEVENTKEYYDRCKKKWNLG